MRPEHARAVPHSDAVEKGGPAVPPGVTAARISGDRFALFFPNATLAAAEQLLSSVCNTVETLDHRHEDKRIELSMSFGLSMVPETRFPLSHALATAEAACKAAKDRGRGRVELYQDADLSIVKRYEDVTIVGELREALASDRFRMEAQPLVLLGSSSPVRSGSNGRGNLMPAGCPIFCLPPGTSARAVGRSPRPPPICRIAARKSPARWIAR